MQYFCAVVCIYVNVKSLNSLFFHLLSFLPLYFLVLSIFSPSSLDLFHLRFIFSFYLHFVLPKFPLPSFYPELLIHFTLPSSVLTSFPHPPPLTTTKFHIPGSISRINYYVLILRERSGEQHKKLVIESLWHRIQIHIHNKKTNAGDTHTVHIKFIHT